MSDKTYGKITLSRTGLIHSPFSEADLTNVIGYLENQIEAHKCRSQDSESSDNVMNSVQDSIGTEIPPKVTFILDTYCHIYMYR